MTRNHLSPLALLLALLALIVPAASAQPPAPAQQPVPPRPIGVFGMNTYLTGLERNRRDGEDGVLTLAARGRQIGAQWAREELSWGNLERDGKGRWQWALFDRRLLAATQAGYGIVGMLLTTPRWARVSDCGQRMERYASAGVRALDYWCPPANPQDYADYVAAVVERYNGDGVNDAPGSPRVDAWQIWNEPNHWETWPGSPAEYAAILQAGYGAAKAADPTAVVATGGVYVLDGSWSDGIGHNDGLRFLHEAIAANGAAWWSFDALAIHPYMPDAAPDQPGLYGAATLWGRISTARAWLDQRMAAYGGPSRQLWISELGWSTCTGADAGCVLPAASLAGAAGPTDEPRLVLGPSALRGYGGEARPAVGQTTAVGRSEAQQADYLVRSYGIALAQGVAHLSWFQLEDKFDGAAGNFWQQAAIFRTAAQGYGPKPAAAAYAMLTQQLAGASYLGPGPLHSYRYEPAATMPAARFQLRFRGGDGALIDLLWRNSGSEAVTLALEPGATAALFTRDGQALPVETTGGVARLTLGEGPLYLRQVVRAQQQRLFLPAVGR